MSVISEEELREIIEVVWMTVLELPVDSSDEQELAVTRQLASIIEITGAWQGVVCLRASVDCLEHAASLMFSIDQKDVQHQDCADTLTELTNMLGGTVKCLLPETCDLSLPSLQSGDVAFTNNHTWFNFTCMDHPFAVAVSENSDSVQRVA